MASPLDPLRSLVRTTLGMPRHRSVTLASSGLRGRLEGGEEVAYELQGLLGVPRVVGPVTSGVKHVRVHHDAIPDPRALDLYPDVARSGAGRRQPEQQGERGAP